MNEIEENKENGQNEEQKIEIKENIEVIDNNDINDDISNEKKVTEEILIVSDNKSKSLENDDNLTNNKDSFSPLIEDNLDANNKLKDDHYIFIERTKLFNIPYFKFGFTTHFYLPSKKLQMKMKLSEIPNPPFTLGPECKLNIIYNI